MLARLTLPLALVVLVTTATLPATAKTPNPRAFVVDELSSPIHETADGAVQDTSWHQEGAGGEGACHYNWSVDGRQKIIFGAREMVKTLGRGAIVRIYRNGRVTPSPWVVPASAIRDVKSESNGPAPGCPIGGKGPGTAPGIPADMGGCGTVPGEARLHLTLARRALEISGRFVAHGMKYGIPPFAGCQGPPYSREKALKILPVKVSLKTHAGSFREPYQRTRDTLLGHRGFTDIDLMQSIHFHYRDGFTLTSMVFEAHTSSRMK